MIASARTSGSGKLSKSVLDFSRRSAGGESGLTGRRLARLRRGRFSSRTFAEGAAALIRLAKQKLCKHPGLP